MNLLRIVVILMLPVLLVACSTTRHYRHEGPKNIEVINDVDVGGWTRFSNHFHVYKVNADCSGYEHLGGYQLTGKKSAELSLPLNELLLIEIAYSKSFMGGSGSLERRDTFIRPKKGEKYTFDFYLRKTTVDLKLTRAKGKKAREMPIIPWSEKACKKLS